ncbi:MAG: class I SAM-dependent methyltransferase [Verrucomicrobia bacterium]|nr:class I SAM-dependent methyltransferase [Verrucomicrobiota bacterium]
MSAARCRACGSTDTTLRGRKPGWTSPREYSFHDCRTCGLLFVEPFAGFEIYDDAYYRGEGPDPFVDYESEYRDWRRTDRGLEFDDFARIADAHLRAGDGRQEAGDGKTELPPVGSSVLSPVSCLPSPAQRSALRWLDFGCGAGGFLKYLRARGTINGHPLELTGHDVGSYADLLARTDGFRILDLAALPREPAATYDVISMIEVIEHLPAPSEQLALVARLLKPGGLLLLTTGNLDGPVARRQGIHYGYCAPEIHVSLFSPRSLAHLYRAHGLVPHPVRYRGVVDFKVLKTLRHRPALRALARSALTLPPVRALVDRLYGVSAMPCATKIQAPNGQNPKKSQ